MKKTIISLALLGMAVLPATSAIAGTPGQVSDEARMSEFDQTRPPVGYVQFCDTFPDDCGPFAKGSMRVHLTSDTWEQLVDVNDHVNTTIAPATDMELYGVPEWWTYPVDAGDCEDYVLLKRRMLMELGWPASALLITVARDTDGEAHALLTVTTTAGDLILDNQNAEIRLWHDTRYSYLMRQSNRDPNVWVSLRDDRVRPQAPVAGTGR